MKKALKTRKSKSTEKQKLDKRNTSIILIQIQNKIKITATQIERKKYTNQKWGWKIGTHEQHEIQDEIKGM